MRNLEGEIFGRLLVLKLESVNIDSHTFWACRCMCGNYKVVKGVQLTRGRTKSCGCLRLESKAKKKMRSREEY